MLGLKSGCAAGDGQPHIMCILAPGQHIFWLPTVAPWPVAKAKPPPFSVP